VLTVIAVGTLLISYALLKPAAPVAWADVGNPYGPYARPVLAGEQAPLPDGYAPNGYAAAPYRAVPYGVVPPATCPASYPAAASQAVYYPAQTERVPTTPRRGATRTVERGPRRDWKKTALVIGGSTAGGAGIGAIFGGKKGALIGAALGGGASTIYEAAKR
jgi:hypothetical protein